MKALKLLLILLALPLSLRAFEKDQITTNAGTLEITFIGHGTLMFQFNGKTIQVDPWSKLADYDQLPKADLILITHAHGDHLDTAAIRKTSKVGTVLVGNAESVLKIGFGQVLKNGETLSELGFTIDAVPAYNCTPDKGGFHPKGRDNGYVIRFGNKKVYVAGDTEDILEMALLKDIDIAFLPVNQPYTMRPEQMVHAVRMFLPKVVYPYHFGTTDMNQVVELMKAVAGTKVVVKSMK